jgi:hypothetical protein
MRAALAILFSLLMVVAQTTPASDASMPAAKRACCGCSCADKSCCVGQATPRAPVPPIAPVRQISSEQLQIVLREAIATVVVPESATWQPIANFSFFSGSTAVPIYYRNCSLLI